MQNSPDEVMSPLKRQAVDALRRARKLPVGPHRNDLRQLAIGLRRLHSEGVGANFRDLDTGGWGTEHQ
jgi:hypothetical protein